MVFNSYDFKVNSVVQVHKDHKAPFFMSGCKVADGVGVMLVYNMIILYYFLWAMPFIDIKKMKSAKW